MQNINQFVLYTTEDGDVKLNLFLEDDTLWLSQKLIGEDYGYICRVKY